MIRRMMAGRGRGTSRRDVSRKEVTAGMLRGIENALWLPAWADEAEGAGYRLPQTITRETADPMPASVRTAARQVAREMERANGVKISELWRRASEADGRPADPENLGYYLTMQALGSGVSWDDDHERFDVILPRVEAVVYPTNERGGWRFDMSMSRGSRDSSRRAKRRR